MSTARHNIRSTTDGAELFALEQVLNQMRITESADVIARITGRCNESLDVNVVEYEPLGAPYVDDKNVRYTTFSKVQRKITSYQFTVASSFEDDVFPVLLGLLSPSYENVPMKQFIEDINKRHLPTAVAVSNSIRNGTNGVLLQYTRA